MSVPIIGHVPSEGDVERKGSYIVAACPQQNESQQIG